MFHPYLIHLAVLCLLAIVSCHSPEQAIGVDSIGVTKDVFSMYYSAQAAIAKISWSWWVNRSLELLWLLASVIVMQALSVAPFTRREPELRPKETKDFRR